MNDSIYEITVPSDQVNTAIQKGLSKGWVLANSYPLPDDQVMLTFKRAAALTAPAYSQGNPLDRPVDPNMAWLELLGFFGFLGIGYLVANRVNDGLIRLIGFWVLMGVGWTVTVVLSVFIIGICLIPVMLFLSFAIPIWSAVTLRNELEAQYR